MPTPPTTQKPTTKSPTQKPTLPTRSPSFRPTVSPSSTIYLYSNNVWEIDGDLGSRTETSWYCKLIAESLNLFCATHAAFLSYSSADNMANIPTNHLGASKTAIPVKSASNVTIATNWNELFNIPRPISLLEAGVFPNPEPEGLEYAYITGSLEDGTYSGDIGSCLGWTSVIDTDMMTVGQASEVSTAYINYGNAGCNGVEVGSGFTKPRVVCACFYDGA
jgi:hypothetical protein